MRLDSYDQPLIRLRLKSQKTQRAEQHRLHRNHHRRTHSASSVRQPLLAVEEPIWDIRDDHRDIRSTSSRDSGESVGSDGSRYSTYSTYTAESTEPTTTTGKYVWKKNPKKPIVVPAVSAAPVRRVWNRMNANLHLGRKHSHSGVSGGTHQYQSSSDLEERRDDAEAYLLRQSYMGQDETMNGDEELNFDVRSMEEGEKDSTNHPAPQQEGTRWIEIRKNAAIFQVVDFGGFERSGSDASCVETEATSETSLKEVEVGEGGETGESGESVGQRQEKRESSGSLDDSDSEIGKNDEVDLEREVVLADSLTYSAIEEGDKMASMLVKGDALAGSKENLDLMRLSSDASLIGLGIARTGAVEHPHDDDYSAQDSEEDGTMESEDTIDFDQCSYGEPAAAEEPTPNFGQIDSVAKDSHFGMISPIDSHSPSEDTLVMISDQPHATPSFLLAGNLLDQYNEENGLNKGQEACSEVTPETESSAGTATAQLSWNGADLQAVQGSASSEKSNENDLTLREVKVNLEPTFENSQGPLVEERKIENNEEVLFAVSWEEFHQNDSTQKQREGETQENVPKPKLSSRQSSESEFVANDDWLLGDDDSASDSSQPFGSFTVHDTAIHSIFKNFKKDNSSLVVGIGKDVRIESSEILSEPSDNDSSDLNSLENDSRTGLLGILTDEESEVDDMAEDSVDSSERSGPIIGSFNFSDGTTKALAIHADIEQVPSSDSDATGDYFDMHQQGKSEENKLFHWSDESSSGSHESQQSSSTSDANPSETPGLSKSTSEEKSPVSKSFETAKSEEEKSNFDRLSDFWTDTWNELTKERKEYIASVDQEDSDASSEDTSSSNESDNSAVKDNKKNGGGDVAVVSEQSDDESKRTKHVRWEEAPKCISMRSEEQCWIANSRAASFEDRNEKESKRQDTSPQNKGVLLQDGNQMNGEVMARGNARREDRSWLMSHQTSSPDVSQETENYAALFDSPEVEEETQTTKNSNWVPEKGAQNNQRNEPNGVAKRRFPNDIYRRGDVYMSRAVSSERNEETKQPRGVAKDSSANRSTQPIWETNHRTAKDDAHHHEAYNGKRDGPPENNEERNEDSNQSRTAQASTNSIKANSYGYHQEPQNGTRVASLETKEETTQETHRSIVAKSSTTNVHSIQPSWVISRRSTNDIKQQEENIDTREASAEKVEQSWIRNRQISSKSGDNSTEGDRRAGSTENKGEQSAKDIYMKSLANLRSVHNDRVERNRTSSHNAADHDNQCQEESKASAFSPETNQEKNQQKSRIQKVEARSNDDTSTKERSWATVRRSEYIVDQQEEVARESSNFQATSEEMKGEEHRDGGLRENWIRTEKEEKTDKTNHHISNDDQQSDGKFPALKKYLIGAAISAPSKTQTAATNSRCDGVSELVENEAKNEDATQNAAVSSRIAKVEDSSPVVRSETTTSDETRRVATFKALEIYKSGMKDKRVNTQTKVQPEEEIHQPAEEDRLLGEEIEDQDLAQTASEDTKETEKMANITVGLHNSTPRQTKVFDNQNARVGDKREQEFESSSAQSSTTGGEEVLPYFIMDYEVSRQQPEQSTSQRSSSEEMEYSESEVSQSLIQSISEEETIDFNSTIGVECKSDVEQYHVAAENICVVQRSEGILSSDKEDCNVVGDDIGEEIIEITSPSNPSHQSEDIVPPTVFEEEVANAKYEQEVSSEVMKNEVLEWFGSYTSNQGNLEDDDDHAIAAADDTAAKYPNDPSLIFHTSKTSKKRYSHVKKRALVNARSRNDAKYGLDDLKNGSKKHTTERKETQVCYKASGSDQHECSLENEEVDDILSRALEVVAKRENLPPHDVDELRLILSGSMDHDTLVASPSDVSIDHFGQLKYYLSPEQTSVFCTLISKKKAVHGGDEERDEHMRNEEANNGIEFDGMHIETLSDDSKRETSSKVGSYSSSSDVESSAQKLLDENMKLAECLAATQTELDNANRKLRNVSIANNMEMANNMQIDSAHATPLLVEDKKETSSNVGSDISSKAESQTPSKTESETSSKMGSVAQKLFDENMELAECLAATQAELDKVNMKLQSVVHERDELVAAIQSIGCIPMTSKRQKQHTREDQELLEWLDNVN